MSLERIDHAVQTKSRPRRSNDNGLGESKKGAVVRKHMGYSLIAAAHAEEMEVFYERYLNPYLNFHRLCGVPEEVTNAKVIIRRIGRVVEPRILHHALSILTGSLLPSRERIERPSGGAAVAGRSGAKSRPPVEEAFRKHPEAIDAANARLSPF
jgi:hypothetical protein